MWDILLLEENYQLRGGNSESSLCRFFPHNSILRHVLFSFYDNKLNQSDAGLALRYRESTVNILTMINVAG